MAFCLTDVNDDGGWSRTQTAVARWAILPAEWKAKSDPRAGGKVEGSVCRAAELRPRPAIHSTSAD